MFKTLFKLVTVFGILLVSYQGYVHTFAFVINRLTADRHVDQIPFEFHDSNAVSQAKEIARRYFGKDHWTSRPDVPLHFNSDRGVYLFARQITPSEGEGGAKSDGKRLLFKEIAVILKTRGGSSTKTITSEEARLDFNKRLGFDAKPDADPLAVTHARLERNVMIRDDRGTPDDLKDDMVVGPLTWIEYDAEKLQVQTDSDILLVDRDLRVTATGLEIKLRPKSDPNRSTGSTGFEGAEAAVLRKNVNMIFSDVGSSGVLPGAVKTKKTADGKLAAEAAVDPRLAQTQKPTVAAEPVPLNIQCDGPMQIDLPNAPMPVKMGPPAPAAPTLVRYNRNVVVRRGKLSELPDQLNCDTLDLTLMPTEKPAPKPKTDALARVSNPGEPAANPTAPGQTSPSQPPAEGKNLFGGLALRRAKASGHAVWLQLPSQDAKILCIELIHNRDAITGKNTTHFLGGSRRLMLVKQDVVQDGPDKGKIQSVTNVWCADATLIDDGDMDRATLVANGPGLLESRPGQPKGDGPPRETPPDRTAVWQDQLWLQNEIGADGAIAGKIVVLRGMPRVVDRLQKASLDAAESIVVWLDSKPEAPKTAQTLDDREVVPAAYTVADPAAPSKPGSGGMTIKRLLAVKDVHLVVPSRDVRYRESLNVDFEQSKLTGSPPAPAASTPTAPAAAPAASATPPAEGQSAAPAPQPAEPLMTAVADRGQVHMIVGPKAPASGQAASPASSSPIPGASDASYQIRDVEMRGGVVLHQDPGPGKTKGTDAAGEVLILAVEGPGKAIFDLYHHDPYSPKTRRVDPETLPRARVSTEEMTIEAKVIGVNQVTNGAWAYGAGTLTQMTDRGLLTDRAPDAQKQAEEGDARTLVVEKPKQKRAGKTKSEKTKITITWADKMTFEGVTVDPMNRPAAKAVFYNDARAEMEDSVLYAGESLTTYTDQPIPLADFGKLTQKPKAANAEDLPAVEDEKPKPDLALLVCKGEEGAVDEREMAVAITRKVDPDRPIIASLQKIAVKELTYDRRSGEFLAPGPGMVFLYDRENDPTRPKTAPSLNNQTDAAPPRRTIRPTAYQSGGEGEDKVAVRNSDAAGAAARRAEATKSLVPPLILTQVQFNKEMRGRFGTGKQDDVNQQRWAEFFGGVQTARCEVPNATARLNYDHLPANAYFLTSETLRVITEPPPAGSPRSASTRNFLKAWDNATVFTKDTTLQADVITYDSLNDLVYANALEGRKVHIVQQAGVGQPGSPGTASAVRMNPKTGALDVANPRDIQLIDNQTGTRPKTQKLIEPDPNAKPGPPAKPKAPPKPKKRPSINPLERRGYTGS